jgi:hypothetical protein
MGVYASTTRQGIDQGRIRAAIGISLSNAPIRAILRASSSIARRYTAPVFDAPSYQGVSRTRLCICRRACRALAGSATWSGSAHYALRGTGIRAKACERTGRSRSRGAHAKKGRALARQTSNVASGGAQVHSRRFSRSSSRCLTVSTLTSTDASDRGDHRERILPIVLLSCAPRLRRCG